MDQRIDDQEQTELAPGVDTPAAGHDDAIARGTIIGRYVVLARVGEGGMGVVHAAYDPELDRKVALKLLRGRAGVDGRTLLLREAQALARISHPHILPVHDVGLFGDRIWMATELVAGRTMRAWLTKPPRPWRAVLELMRAAGRGLAAAHAAGLIHGDFKPDNVMIGDEPGGGDRLGRVRVMDFGLARTSALPSGDRLVPTNDDTKAVPRRRALDESVTSGGSLAGTPAYMAPEQVGGAAADARTDQFAFCVTLWEALFGERPFDGANAFELAASVVAGELRTPPRDTKVPTWLRRVCARGFAATPAARWPSMDVLLVELEQGDARTRKRRFAAGLAGIGLAAAAAFAGYRIELGTRVAACDAAGASIAQRWNAGVAASMRASFVATGVTDAETTADRATPWLDTHASAWQHARTEACLDHEVRGRSSDDELARSLSCLDDRRMKLEALVDELANADADAVHRAVVLSAGLAAVEPCLDAELLARVEPPPQDHRDEVGELRRQLSRASVLDDTGRYAEGLALARETSVRAEALGWLPLIASAHATEANLLEKTGAYVDAERLGKRAWFEAAESDAWDVAARAANDLVFTVGDRLGRHAEALDWGEHARIALARTSDPEALDEAARLTSVATVYRLDGDDAQARALFERALAILEGALGPSHPMVAPVLANLANVHAAAGELTAALALHGRAIAILEATLGPEHPDVALALGNLAGLRFQLGEYAEAKRLAVRAHEITERSLGAKHPEVGKTLANLALLYAVDGENAEARATLARAIAIYEAALGPDHVEVANTLLNLSDLETTDGATHDAVGHLERAVAIYGRHDDVQAGEPVARFALARALVATGGDAPRARALAEQARDRWKLDARAHARELASVETWLAAPR